ncbi:uncharacterized protein LOC135484659 [Lineus longissimus]|uniref:uncharacterized protein LOC135484659 n=1 Tax=Lineus longissimus TaxID=88925 RepID=UPI00315CAA5F
MGMANDVSEPLEVICEEEDPEVRDDYACTRRLKVETPDIMSVKEDTEAEHGGLRKVTVEEGGNKRKLTKDRKGPSESEKPKVTEEIPELPEHLIDLFERSSINLTQPQRVELAKLLLEFQHVFSKDENDIGQTNLVEHLIDTGDALPIKQNPHKVPLAYQDDERKSIQKLLKQGTIRPSTSPWASPIVLVKKKDGTVRPCCDG